MSTKHTPGPWHIKENGFVTQRRCPTVYATDDELRYIAFCSDSLNIVPTDNLANARLIAASPDLYQSLADIVEFCDDPNGSEKDESLAMGMGRLLIAARAAITKATQP